MAALCSEVQVTYFHCPALRHKVDSIDHILKAYGGRRYEAPVPTVTLLGPQIRGDKIIPSLAGKRTVVLLTYPYPSAYLQATAVSVRFVLILYVLPSTSMSPKLSLLGFTSKILCAFINLPRRYVTRVLNNVCQFMGSSWTATEGKFVGFPNMT